MMSNGTHSLPAMLTRSVFAAGFDCIRRIGRSPAFRDPAAAWRERTVVRAAIGHQPGATPHDLAFDDATHIDACFAHQKTPGFDGDAPAGMSGLQLRLQRVEMWATATMSRGASSRPPGMPKPPPRLSQSSESPARSATRMACSAQKPCSARITSASSMRDAQ